MRGSPCSLFCKPMSQVVEGIRVTGGCAEERETAREIWKDGGRTEVAWRRKLGRPFSLGGRGEEGVVVHDWRGPGSVGLFSKTLHLSHPRFEHVGRSQD